METWVLTFSGQGTINRDCFCPNVPYEYVKTVVIEYGVDSIMDPFFAEFGIIDTPRLSWIH